MIAYALFRLARSLVTIVAATLIVFVIPRLSPGDPVTLLVGEGATPETIHELRDSLGLNRSLPDQLVHFLWGAVQGDFGDSIFYGRPIFDLLLESLPRTLILAGVALLLTIAIAVPIGMISAVRRGTAADHIALSGLLVVQSLPTFWIGIMLITIFSVTLGWLPTSGTGSWKHYVLPAVTLATFQLALLARAVRSGMLEVLREDYVRTARAKGLPSRVVLWRHAFRNTLLPIVTILALQLGALIGGAVITEVVFAWPGLGNLAVSAVESRDYPVIQGVVILSAAIIVFLNLLADLLYPVLDPRVRSAR